MGLVGHKEFTSGAELIASYAALRRRLYARPNVVSKPAETQKRLQAKPKPEIKVVEYTGEDRSKYFAGSVPVASIRPTNYNQHIVDYLRHKIREEMDVDDRIVGDAVKSMADVREEVLAHFPKVSVMDINGNSRTQEIVLARQMICFEIKSQLPHKAWTEIGKFIGGKDHSTVMSACRKILGLKERGKLAWFYDKSARDSE